MPKVATEIPNELARQIERIIRDGWFPDQETVVREALLQFIDAKSYLGDSPRMLHRFAADALNESNPDVALKFVDRALSLMSNQKLTDFSLYQMLVAPAAQWIPADARVIIVPDGALHEINFETLTVDAPKRHFWIDDVQVEIAPSLATLTTAAAPVASGPSRLLLVGNARAHEPEFPALAHAAAEMSNVAARFGPDRVTTLEGDRASPAAYSESQPDRFAYVHFAAHATANLDSPLDSVVVLSGPADRFKLYARDVAALRLHAELVTISACRSAGDRAYAGDGLVGFSWAFLKAGARHVVAGLWDLDDGSTPQLMDHLYSGIALGHSPGRALRAAKRAPDRAKPEEKWRPQGDRNNELHFEKTSFATDVPAWRWSHRGAAVARRDAPRADAFS